ncbi:MAG TPA: FAD-dependent monooxygenase [Chitinophagaceae bacterium]|nr:FAD-dependent monooxygenase [Chitinophagaceae bacterium]
MNNKNILISGAGIAGTTLAYWLKRFGFNPTIVEVAPKLREGGYAIDFMGAGYDIADKMGIVPALRAVDIDFSKIVFVDNNGREKGSMNYQQIKKFLKGRALTLLRSDLAKVIYNSLDGDIEVIFGDSIKKIEQTGENVTVSFKSGTTRVFDLLVGADGLHSNIRSLAFGNEQQFEKYYGYYSSSYTINNFAIGNRAFSMYNVPYKQVAVYSNGNNQTTTFFIFSSSQKLPFSHHDVANQKQVLKTEFINCGWKCAELLSQIDSTPDFYFDSISQVKMKNWSAGRVTLVGDACYCPSLLSGKGSTLAMVGAYILAGELKQANGNFKTAFEQYENIFKPFMSKKQKAAQFFAKSFVPKTRFGIWLRNKVFKLMSVSLFSKLFLSQFKDSDLKLKAYS